jgi:hypothetical protein
MKKHKWNFNGDINLEYGGFFWREDGADDYVRAVRITPCSDAGGPDNLFHVEQGSIYMPLDAAKRKSALSVCGYENEANPSRSMLVDSFMAYHGIDRDSMNGEQVVRIGKAQELARDGWNPEPDFVLRGNSSLERFVKGQFLD